MVSGEGGGEGGGEWHLMCTTDGWVFTADAPSYAVTKVHIDDQVIWRMFSKQISAEELKNRVMVISITLISIAKMPDIGDYIILTGGRAVEMYL